MIAQHEQASGPASPAHLSRSELLLPYIPAAVLEGAQRAGPDVSFVETIDGSLLISDISGFTRLADAVSSRGRAGTELLIAILNSYYGRVLRTVSRFGGRPFRFGGDSLVATFSDNGHATRAAWCACAIHATLARAGRLDRGAGGERLRVSSGLHSGRFTLATCGTAQLGKVYMLLGAGVATAARAQDLASPGTTCISAATRLALGSRARLGDPNGEFDVLEGVSGAPPHRPRHLDRSAPSESTVTGFLHPSIVDRLSSARPEEADGEHRRVVVLFLQVDGLHDVADHLIQERPAALLDDLDRLVRAIAVPVRKHGGIVLGTDPTASGQKFLIVFGLVQESEDDESRAVLAAMDIKHTLGGLPAGLSWKAGINAGTVFAGDLGASWRRDYTILGDVVNVGARLAASGERGDVVVHAALLDRASRVARTRPLEPATAKGKPVPLPRFALAGRRTSRSPLAIASEALVGRDSELAQIGVIAARVVSEGKQCACQVTGPPGIGKTAVVGAACAEMVAQGARVLSASGKRLAVERPYAIWADALRGLVGLRRSDPTEASRHRLAEVLERWSPADSEWAPLLGGMLGIRYESDGIVAALDPALRASRLFELACNLLAGAATERPLVLALDDMHEADPGSHDLLAFLLAHPVSAPLLLLVGTRTAAANAEQYDAVVALGGLGDDALSHLGAAVFGGRRLDESVLEWLRSRSQGNPLFAVQLATTARDEGLIEVLPGRGTVVARTELDRLPAPESLQSLLMGRVDRLPEVQRRVAQVASICGQTFDQRRVLWADPATAPAATLTALRRLQDADILVGSGERFSFSQTLLQETLYASLPTARRRPLHRRLAESVERDALTSGTDAVEELAWHFAQAQDSRLVKYALQAGERALTLGDGTAALRNYRAILALPPSARRTEPAGLVAAEVNTGDIQFTFESAYDDALASYRHALERLRRSPIRDEATSRGSILHRIGRCQRRLGNGRAATRALERALLLLDTSQAAERVDVTLELAGLAYVRGDALVALERCNVALREATAAGATRQIARALDSRGVIEMHTDSQAAALADLTEAVAICRQSNELAGEANALTNLGIVYFRLGQWPEAATSYHEARRLWRRVGDFDKAVQASSNLGEVLAVQGDVTAAVELFDECRGAWLRSGFTIGVGIADLFAGQAFARSDRSADAIERLQSAFTAFESLRADTYLSQAAAALAEVQWDSGAIDEARAMAGVATEAAHRSCSALCQACALRAHGVTSSSTDAAGNAALRAAADAFDRLGVAYERAVTVERLAERLLRTGAESADAAQLLADAERTFASLGAQLDLARVKRVRGAAPATQGAATS